MAALTRRRRALTLGLLGVLVPVLGAMASGLDAPGSGPGSVRESYVPGLDELEVPDHERYLEGTVVVRDDVERVNRVALAVTLPMIDHGLRPLARGWRAVVPAPVRTAIRGVRYTLGYPGRLLSLLLQGEGMALGRETAHVLTNAVLGGAGAVDVAGRLGIPTRDDDVGMAFARWGIGPGSYLFVPVLGPSTTRDAVGRIFDLALDPLTYAPVPGLGLLFGINAFSDRVDGYDRLRAGHPEPYEPVRALWMLQRTVEIERYQVPAAAFAAADPEPSLAAMRVPPPAPAFWRAARRGRVTMPQTGRALPYSAWLQPAPAPLVVLVPGIGAHRESVLAASLADLVHGRGFAVVVLSSPFHPEFVRAALTAPYPGYTPRDAADLRRAIAAVIGDLERRWPGQTTPHALLGYSLGALEVTVLADRHAPRRPGEPAFERIVLVNPPVDLDHGGRRFDAFFDALADGAGTPARAQVRDLARRAFLVARGDVAPGRPLPFTRAESEFLIGLSLRVTLASAAAAARDTARGALAAPAEGACAEPWSTAVETMRFDHFLRRCVAPAVGPERDPDEMVRTSGLRRQGTTLRDDARVRVVTNADDFLLAPGDLAWLGDMLGERLQRFATGGHLGNLGDAAVRQAIAAALGPPPP